MNFKERFWSQVKTADPDSCWEWQGFRDKDGYGAFHFQGKKVTASRFAWILTHGEIPPGLHVLHRCDNPACVNPRHLFLGTQRDNMRDAALKLRKSGPLNGRTKLTWPQVDAIRLLFRMGWGQRRIARLFGVDGKTIWQVIRGKTWREPAEVLARGASISGYGDSPCGKNDEKGGITLKGRDFGTPGEVKELLPSTGEEGETLLPFKKRKEEFALKSKGVWFVTERVETPALTLELPVGVFRSKEAAVAFVRGKENRYRMRFIQSDLGDDQGEVGGKGDRVGQGEIGKLGEARENAQREGF